MQASLQSQLETLRRQFASDSASQEEQHLAAARSLEDKVLALRDELHGRERQMAELHINHQVGRGRGGLSRWVLGCFAVAYVLVLVRGINVYACTLFRLAAV